MLRNCCNFGLQKVRGQLSFKQGFPSDSLQKDSKVCSKCQLLDHERVKLSLCPLVQAPGQLRTTQPSVYSQIRWKFRNIFCPPLHFDENKESSKQEVGKTNTMTIFQQLPH